MTERKLNPFEQSTDDHVISGDRDVVDHELYSERKEQILQKVDTDVSDHAHLCFIGLWL